MQLFHGYFYKISIMQSQPPTSAQWEREFRSNVGLFTAGPVRERSCRDVWCLIILVIMLIGLVVVTHKSSQLQPIIFKNQPKTRFTFKNHMYFAKKIQNSSLDIYQGVGGKNIGYIINSFIVLSLLSIPLSLLFIFLLQYFPRAMIWTSLAIWTLFFIILIGFCIRVGNLIAALILSVIVALNICVICYFRSRLEAVIVLIKLSSQFIFQNLSVYLIPFFTGFLALVLGIVYCYNFGIAFTTRIISKTPLYESSGYYGFQVLIFIFFSIFIYYVMTYLIASAVSNWFYMRGSSAACAGCPSIIYHLGSITFASVVITVTKILRMLISEERRNANNIFECLCFCLLQCFMACLQGLIQFMNHFAIIIMSVTGQDYVGSAKTGVVVLYSELPLFAVISTVDNLIYFSGFIFTTVISGLISFSFFSYLGIDIVYQIMAFSLLTFVFLFSCNIFLSIYSGVMNSLFVLYALQMKLVEYGLKAPPVSQYENLTADAFAASNLSHLSPKEMMDVGYPIVSRFR